MIKFDAEALKDHGEALRGSTEALNSIREALKGNEDAFMERHKRATECFQLQQRGVKLKPHSGQ